jgi:hypothetical protein
MRRTSTNTDGLITRLSGLSNSECGNGVLTGTAIPNEDATNGFTAAVMAGASQFWCTKYNVPNAEVEAEVDVSYTKQYVR